MFKKIVVCIVPQFGDISAFYIFGSAVSICKCQRLALAVSNPDHSANNDSLLLFSEASLFKGAGPLQRLITLVTLELASGYGQFYSFKYQKFKLSVSNPKNKYVAYASVLSQFSVCQGLGFKNKHENLKTDRRQGHNSAPEIR